MPQTPPAGPPPGSLPPAPASRPALQHPAELLATGRPADAAEALAAVVAGAPTYAAAYVLLGVALDAASRPTEALAAWHRAAFLVPRSPLVLRERQRLLDAARTAAPAEPPTPSAEPGPRSAAPPVDHPEPLRAPDEPPLDHLEPRRDQAEPQAEHLEPGLDHPEPLPALDEVPVIQTAPLDDFFFAEAAPAGDPDGF
ncbi:MAG TPA: hypothetical protein VGB53_06440, partial [Rubricoccaceae bacterium]